eukprot:4219728-Pyramimonas_sp.AAC.1
MESWTTWRGGGLMSSSMAEAGASGAVLPPDLAGLRVGVGGGRAVLRLAARGCDWGAPAGP